MAEDRFRIRIDGSWSAKEMADLFHGANTIYIALSQMHSRDLYRQVLQQTDSPQPTGNDDGKSLALRVTSISFGSPGWADFLGAGELTGHLKDFLLGIVDRVIQRKDREQARDLRAAEIEAAALENYGKRLELIDKSFDLANRADLSDSQRQQLLQNVMTASRPIAKAVAESRLVSVEILVEDK